MANRNPLLVALLAAFCPLAAAQSETPQELLDIHAEIRALDLNRMEDLGESAFNQRAAAVKELAGRLQKIDFKDWPVAAQTDYALVRSLLSQVTFEHSATRPWRRDPGFYVDRLAAVARQDLPLDDEELDRLRKGLRSVPEIVGHAEQNLTEGAGELAKLALRNLEKADGVGHGQPWRPTPPAGVIGWFEDLLSQAREKQPEVVADAEQALASARQFHDWLKEHEPEMTRPAGIGLKDYRWCLRNIRLIPFGAQETLMVGDRELRRALAQLEMERQRNRNLPPLEPASTQEEYQRRIDEADQEVRAFIRSRDILTLPDDVPLFGHNAPWIVREGGHRNFWEEIQYRDPRPDFVHAVIPGHRFDAFLHQKDSRPVRASFSASDRVEGWGFYLEEMMMRVGLLDDRPRTRELFYIFQAARAIRNRVEIGLHANKLTVDQAVQYMVSEIPYMDEDAARVDCEIYLRQPGYGISYLMGKVQIEKLLSERKRQLGESFSLRQFHDEFLAAGWIPVSLIRWEMTGLRNEIDQLLP